MIHRLLVGDGAELYLPFAQSRLKALEAINPKGCFAQKFIIGDYSIEVQQSPPSQYIRIIGGGKGYFEFFTSGNPVQTFEITQGSITAKTYKTAVVGVDFGSKGVKAVLRGGKRHDNAADGSMVKRPQQVNLVNEPVSEPGKRTGFASFAFEQFTSWAPGHGHTGLHFRSYNFDGGGAGYYNLRGNMVTHLGRDIGVDVPFQYSENKQPIVQAQITLDPADWPREGAVQRVTHETYGTRSFGLMVDAQNMVSVFPLSEIGPINGLNQNVPVAAVAQLIVTLPAWCYKQPGRYKDWYAANPGNEAYGLVDFPDVDWRFSPDGRAMCAIFYQRSAANYDAAYFGTAVGSDPFTLAEFEAFRDASTGYTSRHNTTYDEGYKDQRYISAPGLVEVLITITLTGPNPRDFTIALECVERRTPTTTPYCSVVAGYSFIDLKATDWSEANQHYLVKKGDPVVLDVERYFRADGVKYTFFSLKNLQPGPRFGEIRTFDSFHLLAYDLPTLSFAFMLTYEELKDTKLARRPGDPATGTVTLPFHVYHPSINIFVQTKHQRLLFPDTMPGYAIDALDAAKDIDARALLASYPGLTLLPLNDVRSWSDSELANLRNYYCEGVFHYKAGTGYTTPSDELLNWWRFGLNAYFPPTPLLYINDPKPGWYVYTDELINRMWCAPYTTFFVHPGGTWAFFDQQFIYNQQGIYGPHNFEGLAIFDVAQLEHCIFDHVYLAPPNGKGGGIHTSFIALYNKAVQAGVKAGNLTDTHVPLAKADLKASFVPGEVDSGNSDGVKWLDLQVNWPGDPMLTAYYPETGYPGGAYVTYVPGYPATGGLVDLTLGAAFYSGPGYTGGIFPPEFAHYPVRFSTCLLLQ